MQQKGNTPQKILFYILALACNILLNRVAAWFGLPLFLDSIGTIVAAALGGYVPGVLIGYLTNIINLTADPANAYYAVINALFAVCAAYLAQRGVFEKLWKTILSIPFFTLLGGGLSSVLTYLMYGFGIGEGISAPFAKRLLESGKLSVFGAQIVSDVSIDLLDKAFTLLIVFMIIKLIPKDFASSLRLTGWRQKPLSEKERKKSANTDTRAMSLRGKVGLLTFIIMFSIAFVTILISFLLYRDYAEQEYMNTGQSVAKLAAAVIDGDEVEEYLAKGEAAEGYNETRAELQHIKDTSPSIEYLYVYQLQEDGCHVVFDLDSEYVKASEPCSVVEFDEDFREYVPQLMSGERVDPIVTEGAYGWLMTIFEPIFDSNGNYVCYAAADLDMRDVQLSGISFVTKVSSLFVGFFILVLSLCIWFADYGLIYPISAMTTVARQFAFDSEDAPEQSVERLQALHIDTGDEIENLYEALAKTIAETVGYIGDVRHKGEQIARMQNGLIYVLADMVESRDKNTGDHVKKTAAYVRMLLRKMKESGKYDDLLTDEYIEDVGNSAPLHDVGKIVVSDTILNKPAKLTDEEFEIMKTHTTAGEKILESAMKLARDSSYLQEAKNLATYHHEKWDGSGYPYGIKGEEIPLSARIMAIADVFDALVSKRSYKEPFTIDQAMNIIQEGAGKHFDPELVKIFVDAKEEAGKIAAEHARWIAERDRKEKG